MTDMSDLNEEIEWLYRRDAGYEWENNLPAPQRHAMQFIRAYQKLRDPDRPGPGRYRDGKDAQAWSNWRTGWIIACSEKLPPYVKPHGMWGDKC